MKPVSLILRKIWCGWFFLSGFLFFIPCYPIFLILLSREEWFPIVFRMKKVWARWILLTTGIRFVAEYESEIPKGQAYMICPNHSSYLDILLTNLAFPYYFHFMGKAELKQVPLFNIFFKRMNIAVNRTNLRESHQAFKRASDDLEKGISITVFPEATIPECSPNIGPFTNGAFRIAIEKQVPVVPITFLDNWYLFPDHNCERLVLRPGLSRAIIHKPIPTKGLTLEDVPALKKEVHGILQKCIAEHGRMERRKNMN